MLTYASWCRFCSAWDQLVPVWPEKPAPGCFMEFSDGQPVSSEASRHWALMLINTVSPLPPAGYPKKKNGRSLGSNRISCYWIVLMEALQCWLAAADFFAGFDELFEVNDVISVWMRSAGRRRVFVRGLFTVLVPTVTEHPHRAEPKPPEQLFVRKRSSCSSKRFSFLLSSLLLSFSSFFLSFTSFLLSFCSSVSSMWCCAAVPVVPARSSSWPLLLLGVCVGSACSRRRSGSRSEESGPAGRIQAAGRGRRSSGRFVYGAEPRWWVFGTPIQLVVEPSGKSFHSLKPLLGPQSCSSGSVLLLLLLLHKQIQEKASILTENICEGWWFLVRWIQRHKEQHTAYLLTNYQFKMNLPLIDLYIYNLFMIYLHKMSQLIIDLCK